MSKIYQDKDWLMEYYCEQELSIEKCAKLAGCGGTAIYCWLRKHAIPRRSISEGMKLARRTKVYDSEEIRQKMKDGIRAAWARGCYANTFTEGYRQKVGAWNKAARARGCYDNMYTEEIRQKMSEAAKAARSRGTHSSEETRQRMSASIKAKWARGDYDSKETRQRMSDTSKAAHARGCFDGVYQSPTSIEIAISEALDELGIMHVKQYRPESCRYTYDEYLLAQGILLEINGDYWHSLPGVLEKDARKEVWAREHGFTPVTIWEHEIKDQGAMAALKRLRRR